MSLEIILGCMFSGKTSYLIQLYNSNIHKHSIVCINYNQDIRYSIQNDKMFSHDKQYVECIPCGSKLSSINKQVSSYSMILINEAQFFDDLKPVVLKWVEHDHKHVVCSGLDGDYLRNPFGHILELVPYCDHITKLKGQCSYCKKSKSLFSFRLNDETQQKSIGIHYKPLCRSCFILHNQK